MNEASSAKYTNRLINETSPYLLQHAHNPVDWHPWSDEAFARAKAEDKPVLLSVGYSACHWCHVMEHESFENEAVAGLMNKHFVNVKVDREERPDVDTIYMNAVQMMTGRGGWPMTVFLTPEGVPFFGGTYFPPNDRYGMPGFPKVLLSVAEAYRSRREEILESAGEILKELQQADHINPPSGTLDAGLLERAFANLSKRFDWTHGGFGGAPKFPSSFSLAFMLRHFKRTGDKAALEMVELSLQKMARGGIYDHLGGGFHRYSTDAKWLVPHFEKMLYDNALLARLYVEAYQATGDEFHRFVVEDVLDYVLREMTSPEGGFYSTQDADSEGEEGKFFVWTRKQVLDLLGEEDGDLFCRFYGVTEEGNFEHTGATVLNVSTPLSTVAKLKDTTEEHLLDVLARGRARLLGERETRVKPMRDDKQLTAWNGLMLHALARAGAVLERRDYLQAAVRNAEFVLDKLFRNGRLLRTHKNGESKLNAYLEDYAFFADGLLALYEATFDLRHLKRCVELTDTMIDLFGDEETGGFYFTSKDHEQLISRSRDLFDNATPSGNSVAVDVLSRLAAITGKADYRERAENILASMRDMMVRMPSGFGYLLCALDFHLSTPTEIAVVGDLEAEDTQDLLRTIRKTFLPNAVVVHKSSEDAEAEALIPLLVGRVAVEGKATAYVCENMTCRLPATDAETLKEAMNDE